MLNVHDEGRAPLLRATLSNVGLAGISLQRPHNLTEQDIKIFVKVYLLPCREYFLLPNRNVKVCVGDVP